jgi:dipeptidyl aminopeptidase/acylaminoacyl peptidase
MSSRWTSAFPIALIVVALPISAQQTYQRAPREIREVLDAPTLPTPIGGPTGDELILAWPLWYPPISDLAEPLLRLAGVRINPRNNAVHGAFYFARFAVKKIPDGPEVAVALPPGARVRWPRWNGSGTMFAFTNMTDSAVELWVCDAANAKARRIEGVRLNPVLEYEVVWMPDQKTLLVKSVPTGRGAPPTEPNLPTAPRIEESGTGTVASSTYEARDLLKTPHDADLFDYYATSQLAFVDVTTATVTNIGTPAVYGKVRHAPGGQYLLVERIHRPYSFLRPYNRFPAEVEVWDITGKRVETLASLPLAEQVPIRGVRTGPRLHQWLPTPAATLMWAEALDDGDTYKNVPHHDRIMLKPMGGAAVEWFQTEQRFVDINWIEHGGQALLREYDDNKHWIKSYLLDADQKAAPRLVWSLNSDDQYGNPGEAVYRLLPSGVWAVHEQRGAIFMSGEGASPDGNRPFLDRLELRTLKSERLFRSDRDSLESFIAWVDPAAMTFLTRRESRSDPPNVDLRAIGAALKTVASKEAAYSSTSRAITHFADPTPQLREISKRLVTYQRQDGVQLSFTLYLPPGYKQGTRLPTVLWAYPLDYTDPSAAGQVTSSPQQFTTIIGASPIFFALEGYAVLDETAMPVVGPTETAYDTFVEQIVANAKAAIDKAVELGVTDPERVGVMGHSHGALMTTNLLAWSDLFRAGVARSGAYNHTLRPFGFQNERRTLYKASQTYLKLSPLLHADQINEPLLIIHGERDVNPGTVPLQSEKLFEAVRGVGGTTRLVILPLESHGYAARESVEHTLYEMVSWFDRYVKNAAPRSKQAATTR